MARTREQIAAYKVAWRHAYQARDPVGFAEKAHKHQKAWRTAHPDIAIRRCAEWKKNNPDKVKQQQVAYYAKNKEIIKARLAARERANPNSVAAIARHMRANTPAVYLLANAKRNAKARGVPFNLEPGDIVAPTHCPVLGLELKRTRGKRTDSSPSLDRIVPARGYIKGNVLVISWRANRIKNDATIAELAQVAAFYAQFS